MTSLIFATNNRNKVQEIQSAIGNTINIKSLQEVGIDIDNPEHYDTLEENASGKSSTIHRHTVMSCFSEDTGVEAEALNGAPGVKSARYAGNERSFDKNIEKLLNELNGSDNRNAQFRTVISLIWEEEEYLFEGVCKGAIIAEKRGDSGF